MLLGENLLINDTSLLISISGEDHRFSVVPLFPRKSFIALGIKMSIR